MQTAYGSLSVKDLFISFISEHFQFSVLNNLDDSDGIVSLLCYDSFTTGLAYIVGNGEAARNH